MLFYVKQGIKTILKQGIKVWYHTVGWFRCLGITMTSNGKVFVSFRDKYKGKRCFLIGNGPSLTEADLESIAQNQEISFACNIIYHLYDKVKWRPTYHFISDVIYTVGLSEDIADSIDTTLFVNRDAYREMKKKPRNLVYVNCINQKKYFVSNNILAYYVPAQATVMKFMVEMAMYMGFKEIYLLGVDCTNSFTKGHFTKDYVPTELDEYNLNRARRTMNRPNMTLEELGEYRRERSIMAYQKIQEYARKHGVKIYNASRGGELNVYERVDFDTLMDEEKMHGYNTL